MLSSVTHAFYSAAAIAWKPAITGAVGLNIHRHGLRRELHHGEILVAILPAKAEGEPDGATALAPRPGTRSNLESGVPGADDDEHYIYAIAL